MGIKHSRPVPPFMRYCSAIIPTMFDDSLSYYEALCALNNFVQKNLVEVINNNATVTQEYIDLTNKLKEYVENYFDNLDVQEEINNKLDEMAEDGTLAEIIDEYLYNLASTRCQETLLSMSFGSGSVPGNVQDYLNYSNDGVNWKSVKINFSGRDPSFVYDKTRKCFYISVTPVSNQTHSFKIYKTTDFVTFEEKTLVIGTYYAEDIMGPDLYLDEANDKLIVNFTYATGNTVTDCDGQSIPEYWLYRVDLNLDDDIANIAPANTPQPLVLTGATTTCMIDSNIIYHNNLYYLTCKDDINKIVQIYQSADGYNYNLIASNILNPNDANDNTIYLEGGCLFKFNDTIHITLDSYYNLHTQVVGKSQSNDFIHWTFAPTNMERMRHQSVIAVDDKDLKTVLFTLKNFGYKTSDALTYYDKYTDNSTVIPNGFNGEITAVPNLKYVITGNATITNIRNPFNCDKIECFFAGNFGIKLNVTKIKNVTVDRTFYNSISNNGKLFNIYLDSATNTFPTDDFLNIREYDKTYIQNYFTPAAGISITDGYAIRQGNIVNLSITLTFTSNVDGYMTILTNNSARSTFTPRNAPQVITSNMHSKLSQMVLYNVSGNLAGYVNGVTSGSSYIISGTFITG